MEKKIIIKNRSSQDISCALSLVSDVIKKGRISDGGESYCYVVRLYDAETRSNLVIFAKKNKNSDTFYVLDDNKEPI